MKDDELELRKIYETFQAKILRYLARLVGAHEAEDLTQEVFVKINQALKSFRGEAQLSTWVYRIATNVALDKLRTLSSQRVPPKILSEDLICEGESDTEGKDVCTGEKIPSIEASLIRKEMNECIRDFIENLPESYRTVIVLSELEGLKNNEIAEVLGVTVDTVKIRLHRARARLKRELDAGCNFYRDERNQLACDLKTAFKRFRDSE